MKLVKNVVEVVKKLYSNIWFRTILYIIMFLMFYAFRENVEIINNTITMLNLALMGVFFVSLYQSLNEKRVSLVRFLFIFLFAFILNKFYDSNIFLNIFEFRLIYAVAIIGSIIFLYIIGSKVFALIRKRKIVDLKSKDKTSSLIGNINDYEKITESKINSNNCPHENNIMMQQKKNYKDQNINDGTDIANDGESSQKLESKSDFNNKDTGVKKKPLNRKITDSNWFTIFVFIIIFFIPIFFIVLLFNNNVIDKFNGIHVSNIINVCISLMGLVFLSMYMWAVAVGIFIKLIQTIFNIIDRQNSQNSYLLNASAFLVISYFITKHYDISLDKIIDSLAQGNILSFPIFLIILLPLFLTLLQNLETLIMKNDQVKKRTVELLHGLIFGIIEALLNFIKFTTADFLISIQDIVKEDLNYGTESEEELEENLGEHVDEKAGNKSERSEPSTNEK